MIALLTGAGFSKGYGGLLATDLVSFMIANSKLPQEVRKQLARTNDYEVVLGRLEGKKFGGYEHLFEAMLSAFSVHESLIAPHLDSNASFVPFLRSLSYVNWPSPTYWFTVNQDLLAERIRWNGVNVVLPGTRPAFGSAPTVQSQPPVRMRELVPGMDWKSEHRREDVWLFKLHGSTHFVDEIEGERKIALVAGTRKSGQIEKHPVLQEYFQQFERTIGKSGKLLIIGYSFRDEEVNAQLVRAFKGYSSGPQLFVIDPRPPSDWATYCCSKRFPAKGLSGSILLEGLRGYYQVPFETVFGSGGHVNNEWIRSLNTALGITYPSFP